MPVALATDMVTFTSFVWAMCLAVPAGLLLQRWRPVPWPVGLGCGIVVSAVFFHNLSVESGDFAVLRRALARLTGDRRIQVLLVAFCFGALIEGIAGFGAPVAITAAMLAPTGLDRFAERFPDRTYDVGIAEQHALTSAAGPADEDPRARRPAARRRTSA